MFATMLAAAALAPCSASRPTLTVEHDPRARHVVIGSPTVELPAPTPGTSQSAYHAHALATPITPFTWPVNGWARGFRLRLLDCAGGELGKSRLHHAVVLHLGRRELFHPIYQRIMAFTQESEALELPRSVGIRLVAGDSLGLLIAWMPGEREAEQVRLELVISYLPANTNPRPLDVVPVGFDVNFEPGGGASFDLPAGLTTWEREFTMPIEGRVLVSGGHLHDHARSMALADAASGRTVLSANPRLDGEGRIQGVERRIFGATGEGEKLTAGRRYRLSVTYDNPTAAPLQGSGMGILVALFAPRNSKEWPALDTSAPGFLKDLEAFERSGFLNRQGSGHRHK